MATSLGGIYVDLGLNSANFQKGVDQVKRQTAGLGASLRRSLGGIQQEFSLGLGKGLLGGLAAGFSAGAVKNLLDSATHIKNALKVAGLAGAELDKVYQRLFASAQKNSAPIEALVTLYGRAAQQQKDLGVSSEQLLKFTDNVALALRVAGTNATEASGALLQLGQALGSGTVHAEEFNSILEGAPTIAQAAAAGIKEAGGSVAKLKQLVVDGKLSSKAFFAGFSAGATTLADRAAGAEQTVSGAFVRLQNVLVDVATRFDDSTEATKMLTRFLNGPLTEALQEIGSVFSGVGDGPIAGFVGWINKATDAVLQAAADFGQATGLAKVGESYGAKPYIGPGRIQERIDGAFAGTTYTVPKEGRSGTEITVKNGTVTKPITLDDYPVAGGKKGTRQRQDDYQREIQSIKERTAAIQAETTAMAGINPLVDDYGYAVEKARAKQELLTAAQKAGKEVTPQLAAEIDNAADAYASASAEADRLAESQDKVRQAAEEANGAARDFAGTFVDGLTSGKSAADALGDALKRLADKLINLGLDRLFGVNESGGAIVGGIYGATA
ncbi:tape measure protein [Mesorhizobium sp. SP-1A]|uniref:tape measure protein n=1 Tax=Mesorhizobium sp. SP-1A TaxID=3077840 RepID=UPI0028F74CEF|nr:tape measure protein [Mesorhizobium sp. SP-1A]